MEKQISRRKLIKLAFGLAGGFVLGLSGCNSDYPYNYSPLEKKLCRQTEELIKNKPQMRRESNEDYTVYSDSKGNIILNEPDRMEIGKYNKQKNSNFPYTEGLSFIKDYVLGPKHQVYEIELIRFIGKDNFEFYVREVVKDNKFGKWKKGTAQDIYDEKEIVNVLKNNKSVSEKQIKKYLKLKQKLQKTFN